MYERTADRVEDGVAIPGVRFTVFVHNGPYFLASLEVFRDGMVRCWDELETVRQLGDRLKSGWIVTTVPEGATVHLDQVCQIKAAEVITFTTEAELMKEVVDVVERLNGRPTTSEHCLDALRLYKEYPSEERRLALREAYEAVPAQNRPFLLGDQDLKDMPIRMIVYGEGEQESWSHRVASKMVGHSRLPSIDVQRVLERLFPDQQESVGKRLEDALHYLYTRSFVSPPILPSERRTELETLIRSGQRAEAVRRMLQDFEDAANRSSHRPAARVLLSHAAATIAEYLDWLKQPAAALEIRFAGCQLDPDSDLRYDLMKCAVETNDRALARRLQDFMAEQGYEDAWQSRTIPTRGADPAAFRALLAS